MVTSQEMVSIKKSFFDFDSYHFIKVFMRFSWKEKKIVSLNECHIKRQSTKNATESTVSLGEKFTSFGSGLGPVWVEFGSGLGQVWVRFWKSPGFFEFQNSLWIIFCTQLSIFLVSFFWIFKIFSFSMMVKYFWSRDISNINSCVFRRTKTYQSWTENFDISGWKSGEKRFQGHPRSKSQTNPRGQKFSKYGVTVKLVRRILDAKKTDRTYKHSRSKVFIDRIVMFYRTVSVGDYLMTHPWDHPWRLNPGLDWTWTQKSFWIR